jgi:hypothetical protein
MSVVWRLSIYYPEDSSKEKLEIDPTTFISSLLEQIHSSRKSLSLQEPSDFTLLKFESNNGKTIVLDPKKTLLEVQQSPYVPDNINLS